MHKSFHDQLKKWKKENMPEQKKSHANKKQAPKKNKEKFSKRDLHELMGTNKKVLHRGRGGAYK